MEPKSIKAIVFTLLPLLSISDPAAAQQEGNPVIVVGAMRNVMWKGQLQGVIDLDTITNRQHLYGLGPVEYLSGELMIVEGVAYQSSVLTDTTMKVAKTYKARAPFFVYAHVGAWKQQDLPDSIQDLQQLERYLDGLTKTMIRPFAFRLTGEVESATLHVVNLPKGASVSSPEQAHQGQTDYYLSDTEVEILGFFSTQHKGVFTHHDTFMHMHLIKGDKTAMGHLDNARFRKGAMKLYLPANGSQ